MQKEKVIVLTEAEFSKAINDKKASLIIVDFFAEWCGPCVMMGPVFAKLSEENSKVKFCKINVDDAPKVSEQYEVSSIPCIIFFQEGKEVDRVIGAVSQDTLQEKINDYL